jgi:hypothetical protein
MGVPLFLYKMETKRQKILEGYKRITEFVILYNSHADVKRNTPTLSATFVYDVAQFNYILGRMENYLVDKEDFENFDLMDAYFKKEFDDRGYDWKLFEEHLENLSEDE